MDIFYHYYFCTVWGETTNLILENLCKLQKRAARIIFNAKYDIPSLQLFKKLGWLSIQNRLEYHKSVLMYKCINSSAPDYLCNVFDINTHSNVYSLKSSAKGNLFVPRPNSNFMKRTVHYSGTILQNSLPPNLKLIQNIDLFKKKYTDYLMSKQNNE